MKRLRLTASIWLCGALFMGSLPAGCGDTERAARANPGAETSQAVDHNQHQLSLVSAARSQIGRTVSYDPAYVRLDYPGGDISIDSGVCTDVLIRALRDAFDMDLQVLVHEDMKAAFATYPQNWGLTRPDPNIDHRRVPNLRHYLQRAGCAVAVTAEPDDYMPGDIVTCTVPPNLPHIMIVSDRVTRTGVPLVIHNIGRGTREEGRLFEFPLTGHYRINADSRPAPTTGAMR